MLTHAGPLRIALALLVASCLPLAFLAGAGTEGWGSVATYVAPVLAVLLFWVVLLDLLMARVMSGTGTPEAEARLRAVLRWDLTLLAALLLFWGPYFYGLLAP